MKEQFRSMAFTAESRRIITKAQEIIERYARQGYDLSLRQLYYQFISVDYFPNTEQSYKRLGDIVANARDAGLIDWDRIKDRGRSVEKISTWASPADILDSAAYSFRLDLWQHQPKFVMCMVEKQALEGVLEPVCRELRIPFSANKGYASASHMYEIGQTLRENFLGGGSLDDYDWNTAYNCLVNCDPLPMGFDEDATGIDREDEVKGDDLWQKIDAGKADYDDYERFQQSILRPLMKPHETGGKELHVIYLGDHDPSGIDMTRDVGERLSTYSRCPVSVHRIALNMDQVRHYNPPPNPAKVTDSRAEAYIKRFGRESWELDALNPSTLASLVRDIVGTLRDADIWADDVAREEELRAALRQTAQEYRANDGKSNEPTVETPEQEP